MKATSEFDWDQDDKDGAQGSSQLPEAEDAGAARRVRRSDADGNGERHIEHEGACRSITLPSTRQYDSSSAFHVTMPLQGTAAVDWLTSTASVNWSSDSLPVFELLDQCRSKAAKSRESELFPLGDGLILVRPSGYGHGRATHYEYVLDWCGVTIAMSPRTTPTRKLPNLEITISGEPCLMRGHHYCRQRVLGWIEDWGGEIIEEWPRRLDVCLDLPGIDAGEELFPALENCQYVSAVGRCRLDRVKNDYTGFTLSSTPATVVIYDKLAEILSKKTSEAKRQGMLLNRWGGVLPEAAVRVEYRVNGRWLKSFGITLTEQIAPALSGIIDRLTSTQGRRFFAVTKDVPDRANRHQDRAENHPLWQLIIETFAAAAGKPEQPLQRVKRQKLSLRGYFDQLFGLVASAAAQSAVKLDSVTAFLNYVAFLVSKNEVTDERVLRKYEQKARKQGTWNEAISLPPNLAA